MSDIYETNAPVNFPAPKEQPPIEEDSLTGEVLKSPPVKENVDRWKKEIIEKIKYLRENLELANKEKETLSQEVDRLQLELADSKGRVQQLEAQFSDSLDTFNRLLDEVSQALET
jgi:predicted RNase H-like nuclease (RuvC/YqgF family)